MSSSKAEWEYPLQNEQEVKAQLFVKRDNTEHSGLSADARNSA